MIARIERSGVSVSSAILDSIFPTGLSIYNITDIAVSGPILGMILRNAMLVYDTYTDSVTWIRQMFTLVESKNCKDDEKAGYSSWSAYVKATKPCGLSRARVSDLIGFWERVAPQLVAINIDPLTVFASTGRSVVSELVSLYSDPAMDADGVKLLTSWVINHHVSTCEEVIELKTNYGIRNWSRFADRLRSADLDPVGVGEDMGPSKLHHLAQFILSGQLDRDEVRRRVAHTTEAGIETVAREMGTPHGRATNFGRSDPTEQDDAEEEEGELRLGENTAIVPMSQGRGATDVSGTTSTPIIEFSDHDLDTFILNVQQRPDGVLTILSGEITPSLAATLQRVNGAIFLVDKVPARFSSSGTLEPVNRTRRKKG